jgi:hypothetical protein
MSLRFAEPILGCGSASDSGRHRTCSRGNAGPEVVEQDSNRELWFRCVLREWQVVRAFRIPVAMAQSVPGCHTPVCHTKVTEHNIEDVACQWMATPDRMRRGAKAAP